jgi:hypothetical protein
MLFQVVEQRVEAAQFILGIMNELCDDFPYGFYLIDQSDALTSHERARINITIDHCFVQTAYPEFLDLVQCFVARYFTLFELLEESELKSTKIVGCPVLDRTYRNHGQS